MGLVFECLSLLSPNGDAMRGFALYEISLPVRESLGGDHTQ